jgi:lipoprotein-anchoring transpeptidase ErfK/SrfK
MSADQLKAFNHLSSDVIHVGDVLKIPTLIELAMMVPAPEVKPASPVATGKAGDPKRPAPATVAPTPMPGPILTSEAKSEFETVLLQVYLDRKQFATGPIDGHGGPVFKKILELYLAGHPEAADPEALRETARAELGNPYTSYRLKAEDFAFIAMLQNAPQPSRKKSVKAVEPPVTYEQLVVAPMLAYRSPWEFVAERFHCEEGFLRKLNSKIANFPSVGTELLVPNVLPFEIEKMYEGSLQPPADPQNPTVAAVVDLARLEISRGDKLVAVMPLGLARPDLRGRGSWKILDAIPRPRLATLQEIKEQPKKKPLSSFAPDVSTPQEPPPPAPGPALSSEQYLHCGPNNPIGVAWINLAKATGTEPLPYGLHGTSIPERMRSQEGIGGIRLANWDIARAVRLLPPGTPLKWK